MGRISWEHTEKLTLTELAKKIEISNSGDISKYISDLESAGYISRDYTWDIKNNGKTSKLSKIRILDNYLRFYLKYIAPNEEKLKKNIFKFSSLDLLLNWDTISGPQFENLILNNAQIDLLVQCKRNCIYVIEIKNKNKIGIDIINEVEEKIKRIELPKTYSIRTCLIYMGELSSDLEQENYFDIIYDFANLLV